MTTLSVYSTAVVEDDLHVGLEVLSFSFAAIHMRAGAEPSPEKRIRVVAEGLGLQLTSVRAPVGPTDVRRLVEAALFTPELLQEPQSLDYVTTEHRSPVLPLAEQRFYEYCFSHDILAVEFSPPALTSLAKLAVSGGAGLGVAVALGLPWVALLTVPAGVVLFRQAEDLAPLLHTRLRAHLNPLNARLRQYSQLRDEELITDEQFEEARTRLIEQDLS